MRTLAFLALLAVFFALPASAQWIDQPEKRPHTFSEHNAAMAPGTAIGSRGGAGARGFLDFVGTGGCTSESPPPQAGSAGVDTTLLCDCVNGNSAACNGQTNYPVLADGAQWSSRSSFGLYVTDELLGTDTSDLTAGDTLYIDVCYFPAVYGGISNERNLFALSGVPGVVRIGLRGSDGRLRMDCDGNQSGITIPTVAVQLDIRMEIPISGDSATMRIPDNAVVQTCNNAVTWPTDKTPGAWPFQFHGGGDIGAAPVSSGLTKIRISSNKDGLSFDGTYCD